MCDQLRVANGGQVHHPNAVSEFRRDVGGKLRHQAALATTTGANETYEPLATYQRLEFSQLAFSSDEACQRDWLGYAHAMVSTACCRSCCVPRTYRSVVS